jgi:hypothetical protein
MKPEKLYSLKEQNPWKGFHQQKMPSYSISEGRLLQPISGPTPWRNPQRNLPRVIGDGHWTIAIKSGSLTGRIYQMHVMAAA